MSQSSIPTHLTARDRPVHQNGTERHRETRVVHCKKSAYDIYIGRPSLWGNPFVIGKDGDRATVIAKYATWIQAQPQLMAKISDLKGKVLGCWCWPAPCHGKVLSDLANADSTPTNLLSLTESAKGV